VILIGLHFFIEDPIAILMERRDGFDKALLREFIEIDIKIIESEAAERLIRRMAIAQGGSSGKNLPKLEAPFLEQVDEMISFLVEAPDAMPSRQRGDRK
jgi:hypothetical protein